MVASQREKVPVVEMRGVTKVYRSGSSTRTVEVRALSGVDLTIYPGEYVALMGPSGSGKSTLMHIIGLLDTPTEGEYRLGGEPVRGLSEAQLARIRNQRVGFVFQAFFLLPRLTALHNVALPLVYRGLPLAERLKRARAALEAVGLGDRLDHLPSELSGGQKQRVAIARALVQEPDLLLADEPTGNLDSRSSDEILGLFDALHRQGKTIVMVTHEPDVGARAQRIVRLRDGRVAEGGVA
ncbi:ABC transporter ATP-binding protein [Meiothermus taiwanensis]|jgi:putative ABC transport system ATP-binding protein|uniref:ABC transporter ATP-binding protein n=1 Tax=Meiothermus taiwanensis TaxID=172827 RepID=UPI0005B74DE4|nr:ABC transporter ATP-binding protein [Meiothermus taiwanensis]KIQ55708.1 macrolide ABC transporter ATP-binding protein [Meiothermus taiwanensis]